MPVRQDLFQFTVNQLRGGATVAELTDALHECVVRARETGKAAKLTLVISVKPNGDGQYELRDKIKQELPEPTRAATLMFGTPEDNLTRDDPRQQDLPLRRVADAPQELRKVGG